MKLAFVMSKIVPKHYSKFPSCNLRLLFPPDSPTNCALNAPSYLVPHISTCSYHSEIGELNSGNSFNGETSNKVEKVVIVISIRFLKIMKCTASCFSSTFYNFLEHPIMYR